MTLTESTTPSQNIPPFSTTVCDASRIYPSLPEYTPFSKNVYVRPSQKLPLPTRIYPPFNNYMQPSQDLPLPPRIYPHFQQLFYHATLPESIPPSQNIPPFQQLYATLPETTLPSENTPLFLTTICHPPHPPPSLPEYILCPLSTILQESTPQSLNMPPFLETTCNCERLRIYHSPPELKNILGVRGRFWEGRIL